MAMLMPSIVKFVWPVDDLSLVQESRDMNDRSV